MISKYIRASSLGGPQRLLLAASIPTKTVVKHLIATLVLLQLTSNVIEARLFVHLQVCICE